MDLPFDSDMYDLDELSDNDLNDFSEDGNTSVCN